jgi:hypothetical protein
MPRPRVDLNVFRDEIERQDESLPPERTPARMRTIMRARIRINTGIPAILRVMRTYRISERCLRSL